MALLLPDPRFSPETSNATHGRFGARQKSLRSIDCIASRFDLIAQCRSVRFPEETVVITCASPRRTMTLVDVADVQRMPEVRARAADLFREERSTTPTLTNSYGAGKSNALR